MSQEEFVESHYFMELGSIDKHYHTIQPYSSLFPFFFFFSIYERI